MTAVTIPSRAERRKNFDASTHFALIDDDLDVIDGHYHEINAKLSRVLWFAVSATVSFISCIILLILNLMKG